MNHYLCALLFVVAVPPGDTLANDAVDDCARIASAAERIACLEEAVERLEAKSAGREQTAPAAPEPGESATIVTTAAQPAAAPAGPPPREVATIPPEGMVVTVTGVGENAYGKLLFTTGEGDVWIQTDQANRRFVDLPFEARIRPGASGSFFLQKTTGGPSVRVRRHD